MSNKRKTKLPNSHPAKIAKKNNKKWSWAAVAAHLGISVKKLKKNYDNLTPELADKLEEYINGDS